MGGVTESLISRRGAIVSVVLDWLAQFWGNGPINQLMVILLVVSILVLLWLLAYVVPREKCWHYRRGMSKSQCSRFTYRRSAVHLGQPQRHGCCKHHQRSDQHNKPKVSHHIAA